MNLDKRKCLLVNFQTGRIYCVREDHSGKKEAVNTVVTIDPKDGSQNVLVVLYIF